MIIGVIEKTSSNEKSDAFERYLHDRVEQVIVKKMKTNDELDALALLNKTKKMDKRVLIIELNKEEPEKEKAFYEALANWEANNGLTIFKLIYYTDEQPDINEFSRKFIEKAYKVKVEEEGLEKEEEEFQMPGTDVDF